MHDTEDDDYYNDIHHDKHHKNYPAVNKRGTARVSKDLREFGILGSACIMIFTLCIVIASAGMPYKVSAEDLSAVSSRSEKSLSDRNSGGTSSEKKSSIRNSGAASSEKSSSGRNSGRRSSGKSSSGAGSSGKRTSSRSNTSSARRSSAGKRSSQRRNSSADRTSASDETSENSSSDAFYQNPQTGYKAQILDNADLFTDEQEKLLLETMKKLTEYGNAGVVTNPSSNPTSGTQAFTVNACHECFGTGDSTMFGIDMYKRYLYLYSEDSMHSTVTDAYADSITDNVYTYASKSDYYTCAVKVFEQELSLFQGKRIRQPMKVVSNILLALIISMVIFCFIIRRSVRTKAAGEDEIMNNIYVRRNIYNDQIIPGPVTKTYSPQESVSASGGGGFSGGGGSSGGGGGGHSGGGGGHSF